MKKNQQNKDGYDCIQETPSSINSMRRETHCILSSIAVLLPLLAFLA
jgi:hypothetical protein